MRSIRFGVSGTIGLELLERRRMLAFDLLADVGGLSATPSVTVDGVAYFFADDGVVGRELWRSDHTAAGTTLVKDLTPGAGSTTLDSLFAGDGRAIFITAEHASLALDGKYTIWSTDGAAEGTVELASFTSAGGVLTKQVGEQVALLFYREHEIANKTLHDALLYFTDGTADGTRLVKEYIANPDDNEIGSPVDRMFAAGDRVLFFLNSYEMWSSDGTPEGTIDLSPKINPPEIDEQRIIDEAEAGNPDYVPEPIFYPADCRNTWEVGGKVVVPDVDMRRKLWVTDGTLAGSVSRELEAHGGLHGSAIAGDTYYFYVDNFKHTPRNQTLYAFDLGGGDGGGGGGGGGGTIQPVYSPPPRGEEDTNQLSFFRAGDRLLFADREQGSGVPGETPTYRTELWSTAGIAGDAVKLADLPVLAHVHPAASIGDIAYFVVGGPPTRLHADLWRSDGTPAGTGIVTTLLDRENDGTMTAGYTVTAVNGKLVLKTLTWTGLVPGGVPSGSNTPPPQRFEDTAVYDPRELTIGRQAATARLVNGVLHVRGSIANDRIRLFRRASDPDELVVEYNGNVRGFAFSSIRRIVADLQSGDDFFEIDEGEGGVIRTRTSIMGGDGADTINTGRGRDTILGGTGPDIIRARGNGDVINAGDGRDKITAGAGEDQIAGGTSYDRITAGPGVDVLFGQSVIEYAFGRDLEGEDLDEDVLLA